MLQILNRDGELLADPPYRSRPHRRLYRAMNEARTYDTKSTALQKQGRLATYSGFLGQEAAQVGSAATLEMTMDGWLLSRRGCHVDAGVSVGATCPWATGDERGGRPPEHVLCCPRRSRLGGHMIHAVGLSWASRLQGKSDIAITYFGDGATSEGDFHEAMNFRGRVPDRQPCSSVRTTDTPSRSRVGADRLGVHCHQGRCLRHARRAG